MRSSFQQAIQRVPEFALMLMSIMINRLRLTDAMARMTNSLPNWGEKDESMVFDRKLVEELAHFDFSESLPERQNHHERG
jgi:CRP-like cAMP-binding protein